MTGRTSRQAVQGFLDSLQRSFSCITKEVLDNAGGYYSSDKPHGVTFKTGLPVALNRRGDLAIVVRLQYEVTETSSKAQEPWQVTTLAYYYTLKLAEGPEILAYHWHPYQRSPADFPHLHLKAGAKVGRSELAKAYLPTGRVMAEDFVQLLIEHFSVRPLRNDWRDALAQSRAEFEEDKSWGGRQG